MEWPAQQGSKEGYESQGRGNGWGGGGGEGEVNGWGERGGEGGVNAWGQGGVDGGREGGSNGWGEGGSNGWGEGGCNGWGQGGGTGWGGGGVDGWGEGGGQDAGPRGTQDAGETEDAAGAENANDAYQLLDTAGWHARYEDRDVRLNRRRSKLRKMVQEHYLREDIACGSARCQRCPKPVGGGRPSSLSATARHYVIPDEQSLLKCLEIWEMPDIPNIIFLASVLRELLLLSGQRKVSRAWRMALDRRKESTYFDDLHSLFVCLLQKERAERVGGARAAHRDALGWPTSSLPRGARQPMSMGSSLLAAADWYAEHLNFGVPIVVVSDALAGTVHRSSLAEASAAAKAGQVVIMSNRDYFDMYWSHSRSIDILVDFLIRIRPEVTDEEGGREQEQGFSPYLPASAIDEGVAAGELMVGVLSVSPLDPTRAVVHHRLGGGGGDVVIPNPTLLNRAVHGDTVAVRLLTPEDEGAEGGWEEGGEGEGWGEEEGEREERGSKEEERAGEGSGGAEASGAEWGREEGSLEEEQEGRGPTPAGEREGEVVGIVHRPERDLVVALVDDVAEPGGARDRSGLQRGSSSGSIGRDQSGLHSGSSNGSMGREQSWGREHSGGPWPGAEEGGAGAEWGRGEGSGALPGGRSMRSVSSSSSTSTTPFGALCVPLDSRLPLMYMRTRYAERLRGQRFVVRLDAWERRLRHPDCHVVRALGPLPRFPTLEAAVLVEQGVSTEPFGAGALQELPRHSQEAPWSVPPEEAARRRDLRGIDFAASIDPPGSKDVDDVLSVHRLPNGDLEFGVHIADVAYFVEPGSFLDAEARNRGTTAYMVTRRFDMLPATLSEVVCSLVGGQDRLAVSVVWTVDPAALAEGRVSARAPWFGRTVIRSQHQMTYNQAQAILDSQPGAVPPEWRLSGAQGGAAAEARARENLRLLSSFSQAIHRRRAKMGALELTSVQLRFELNDRQEPTALRPKEELPMNEVVAELMIFANSCVARRILQAFPQTALIRRHAPPRPEPLQALQEACRMEGIDFKASSSRELAQSLERVKRLGDADLEAAVSSLGTRCLSEAEYVCSGALSAGAPSSGGGGTSDHYGLAIKYYTHFTSPIRRYADVVVHRMLLRALEDPKKAGAEAASSGVSWEDTQLQKLASHLNLRHRSAKSAQKRASYFSALWLLDAQRHHRGHAPVSRAVVMRVGEDEVSAYVPEFDLEASLVLECPDGFTLLPRPNGGGAQTGARRRYQIRTAQWTGPEQEAAAWSEGQGSGSRNVVEIYDSWDGSVDSSIRLLQRVWVEIHVAWPAMHWPSVTLRVIPDSDWRVKEKQKLADAAPQKPQHWATETPLTPPPSSRHPNGAPGTALGGEVPAGRSRGREEGGGGSGSSSGPRRQRSGAGRQGQEDGDGEGGGEGGAGEYDARYEVESQYSARSGAGQEEDEEDDDLWGAGPRAGRGGAAKGAEGRRGPLGGAPSLHSVLQQFKGMALAEGELGGSASAAAERSDEPLQGAEAGSGAEKEKRGVPIRVGVGWLLLEASMWSTHQFLASTQKAVHLKSTARSSRGTVTVRTLDSPYKRT